MVNVAKISIHDLKVKCVCSYFCHFASVDIIVTVFNRMSENKKHTLFTVIYLPMFLILQLYLTQSQAQMGNIKVF